MICTDDIDLVLVAAYKCLNTSAWTQVPGHGSFCQWRTWLVATKGLTETRRKQPRSRFSEQKEARRHFTIMNTDPHMQSSSKDTDKKHKKRSYRTCGACFTSAAQHARTQDFHRREAKGQKIRFNQHPRKPHSYVAIGRFLSVGLEQDSFGRLGWESCLDHSRSLAVAQLPR